MMMSCANLRVGFACLGLLFAGSTLIAAGPPVSPLVPQSAAPAQSPQPPNPGQAPTAAEPAERLGPNLFRVGTIRVDTAKREISLRGTANEAHVLEFIASTKGGFKGYESALELDTNAISFNLALILIGLDREHAVHPRFHFDPIPPKGDPVEIWVEWDENGTPRKIRAEQLVYNERTKRTLPEGPWVYTGSVFVEERRAYMADMDGTLIGFVHTPSPIIENPAAVMGPYGANRLNPALNLKAGTAVTVTVRALQLEGK
jgi:hypothetical protein